MIDKHPASIAPHVGPCSDPRVECTRAYAVRPILTITIGAVLVGNDGPTRMEPFGKAKADWLPGFLEP
jgi:hypothetical protein